MRHECLMNWRRQREGEGGVGPAAASDMLIVLLEGLQRRLALRATHYIHPRFLLRITGHFSEAGSVGNILKREGKG